MRQGDELSPAGRALGTALVDPALAMLNGAVTRLIVVPDGPLNRVPWDLLRLPDGRYLIERYAVSVAPSAAILAALWRHPRWTRRLPITPGVSSRSAIPSYARRMFDRLPAVGLPRLEGSGREARLVARYSPDAEVRLRARRQRGVPHADAARAIPHHSLRHPRNGG